MIGKHHVLGAMDLGFLSQQSLLTECLVMVASYT